MTASRVPKSTRIVSLGSRNLGQGIEAGRELRGAILRVLGKPCMMPCSKRLYSSVLAVLITSFPAISQKGFGTLEGNVIGQDGSPLPGATVNIDRTDGGRHYLTKTNKKGHFIYMGLPPGQYNVAAFGSGHRLLGQANDVQIEDGRLRELDLVSQAQIGAVPPFGTFTIPFGLGGGVVVDYQIETGSSYGGMFQNRVSGRLTNTTGLPVECVSIHPVVAGTPEILLGITGVRLASGASRPFSQEPHTSPTNVRATGISAWEAMSCMSPLEYRFIDQTVTKSFSGGVVTGSIRSTQIAITVENNSDQPIEVDWNGSSFVDMTRSATRIFHSGVKYTDREQSLPNTTIPPLARVEDSAVPTANVHFSEGSNGGWREEPLFPGRVRPELAEAAMRTLKGAKVALFLQLLVDGKKTPVTLMFEVSEVRPGTFN
jgi:hypothetical protein